LLDINIKTIIDVYCGYNGVTRVRIKFITLFSVHKKR